MGAAWFCLSEAEQARRLLQRQIKRRECEKRRAEKHKVIRLRARARDYGKTIEKMDAGGPWAERYEVDDGVIYREVGTRWWEVARYPRSDVGQCEECTRTISTKKSRCVETMVRATWKQPPEFVCIDQTLCPDCVHRFSKVGLCVRCARTTRVAPYSGRSIWDDRTCTSWPRSTYGTSNPALCQGCANTIRSAVRRVLAAEENAAFLRKIERTITCLRSKLKASSGASS